MLRMVKVALIVLLAIGLSACSFSVSTASISDVKTGSEIEDGEVVKEVKVFATDAPQIFVTAKLNNAPEGTKLTFLWRYLEDGGTDIDSVTVETESGQNLAKSSLSMPTEGWPPGDYEVVLKLDTDNSEPVRKKFSVE